MTGIPKPWQNLFQRVFINQAADHALPNAARHYNASPGASGRIVLRPGQKFHQLQYPSAYGGGQPMTTRDVLIAAQCMGYHDADHILPYLD